MREPDNSSHFRVSPYTKKSIAYTYVLLLLWSATLVVASVLNTDANMTTAKVIVHIIAVGLESIVIGHIAVLSTRERKRLGQEAAAPSQAMSGGSDKEAYTDDEKLTLVIKYFFAR